MDLLPILSSQESDSLFSILKKSSRYPTGKRNQAIISLAYSCGLRISEIIGHEKREGGGLRIRDVNLFTGEITVRDAKDTRKNKTGKMGRTVFISGKYLTMIKEYWEIRKLLPYANDSYFFTNRNGGRVANREARAMFTRYCERAGIAPEKKHLHALRHTCGTNLVSEGTPLHVVQKILGHSNLQVTSVYLHATTEDIKKALLKHQG